MLTEYHLRPNAAIRIGPPHFGEGCSTKTLRTSSPLYVYLLRQTSVQSSKQTPAHFRPNNRYRPRYAVTTDASHTPIPATASRRVILVLSVVSPRKKKIDIGSFVVEFRVP
ncbi:hypothetical protein Trydic_g591 [Trypoxylus dichotomus]